MDILETLDPDENICGSETLIKIIKNFKKIKASTVKHTPGIRRKYVDLYKKKTGVTSWVRNKNIVYFAFTENNKQPYIEKLLKKIFLIVRYRII